jgi:AraC-like DNA-binding protein
VSEPTTLASWAAAIAAALRVRGCDAPALFAAAGLDYAATKTPGARFPVRDMTRLWQLAIDATGDPAFGLEVPRHVRPATMHVLGLSLRASPTLGDALLRMARYSRLVTDGADIQLEHEGERISIVYRAPQHDVPMADAAYEAFMATAVRLARTMAGNDAAPLACEFHHRAPADVAIYERSYGCPVRFARPRNRLVFARHLLQRPLPGADAQRAQRLDADAAAYLARFDATPVSQKVREWLIRQLPAGEPKREAVAAALKLTPRTLLRRLADENAHYKALLNDTRRELAFAYLRQNRSGAEITYLLGFTDPANFSRAFRRWTGRTPRQWRLKEIRNPARVARMARSYKRIL